MTQQTKSIDIFRLKPLAVCVHMAIAGGVFIGSVSPVYAELPIPEQIFATMGAATATATGDALHIDQQTDRAVLNWQSFNVGPNNHVQFNQPNSSSIALNRIFQNDPSQILGKVSANGQIYLYNQNGFVFGKDSTVDVNTLVTTTLNVADEVFKKGIVREFDDTGKAVFEAEKGASKTSAITVEAGAQLKIGKNGRLIMAAPEVTNKGDITADEQGQILLVASKDKVYLQPAASDSAFAGLLVEVGSGGKVSNLGNILTKQGNVTMAGFAVNQEGRVTATTSVNVNGSIRLLAREGGEKQSQILVATSTDRKNLNDGLGTESKVVLGKGSKTEIIADANGGSAIDEQHQPLSYIEMSGNTIEMASGSSIEAPGGQVNVTATNELLDPIQGTKGRIFVDKDATINVAGIKHIDVPIERNVVDVPVQTYELRDSPLQKDGVLKGSTIKVDVRKDTEIVDVSGAKARFERTIDERLGEGGEINFISSGDVIVNKDAILDISGGSIDYQDGYINTTKLLTDYGSLVDISDADPNQHFAAVYGVVNEVHTKWGPEVTKVWNTKGQFGEGVFEKGYTEGLAAGAINLVTPTIAWNGSVTAGSVGNNYQRSVDTLAFGGAFTLDTASFISTQNILIQDVNNTANLALTAKFPKQSDNQKVDTILPTQLTNQSGLQAITIKTFADVSVAPTANIMMNANSSLTLDAGHIGVAGNIYSPSGSITLMSRNTNIPENSGKIDISEQANINVSGRWVNDYALGLNATPVEPIAIEGGKLVLQATGDINVTKGSTLAADGGAWLALSDALVAGQGGQISLKADVRSDSQTSVLTLQGDISASALSKGGSLTLNSSDFILGTPSDEELQATPNAVVLGVTEGHFDFDKNSTLGAINLTSSAGDLLVKSSVGLDLIQKNQILDGDFRQASSAQSLAGLTHVEVLAESLRSPVNLSLDSVNRNVIVESGSSITADKQAQLDLSARAGGIYVDGQLTAPAGKINLAIAGDPGLEYNAAQAIWLGSHGVLDVSGTTRLNPVDGTGHRTGQVLSGGEVVFDAERGYVITEAGSQINISGTKASLDIAELDQQTGAVYYKSEEIGSDAGQLSFIAAEGGVLEGDFIANAGYETNLGGKVEVSLDRTKRNPPDQAVIPFPNQLLQLNITQSFKPTLTGMLGFNDVIPKERNGQIVLSADKLMQAGVEDLRLISNDKVTFNGDVTLAVKQRVDIDSPVISWAGQPGTSGQIKLSTGYLHVGSSLVREVNQTPVLGLGTFTANSQWTEFSGGSLWDNFNQINLSSVHDTRVNGLVDISVANRDYVGTLSTAANLHLTASQLYPTTLSRFTFAVINNPEGEITVSSSGVTEQAPMAAGGELNFNAATINQNGVIKAPFGAINLVAQNELNLGDGGLTSVSGNGQIIPFGVIQGGLDWLYPLDNNHNLVFTQPPEKELNLSSSTINVAKGSVVDLSGGGDLLAYEFLPGSGGSADYLDPKSSSYNGGFAVVPSLNSDLAPFDHLQNIGFDYAIGSKVHLIASSGLPAGEYTILPPRYALLPGGFLVTPQTNTQDLVATTHNAAGLPIVPGYQIIAQNGTSDQRRQGYLLESGTDIRKHSEYDEQQANAFYLNKSTSNNTSTPMIPMDSGRISITAEDRLLLDGKFKVLAAGGRGARMDIAANKLKIVNTLSATPTLGTLEVLDENLSNLGVDSLFLGGNRTNDVLTGITQLNISSDEVTFDANAQVTVTDLVVAAKNTIEVNSGAVLTAKGTVNTGDNAFTLTGDGALLRISADKQVDLVKQNIQGTTGELIIHEGANLASSSSMLLDASKSTTLAGNIQMSGGALNLSANSINLGDVKELSDSSLNLSNEKLLSLAVDELVLSSKNRIGLYGNIGQTDTEGNLQPIKFDSLVINALGFTGMGSENQHAKIEANTLLFQNDTGLSDNNISNGAGALSLTANNYLQGQGNFAMNGFSSLAINAANSFASTGQGTLVLGGDTTITTGEFISEGSSQLIMQAAGQHIALNNNGAAINAANTNLGGQINVLADSIDMNANINMPSGGFSLHALTGAINVASNANINLAGKAVAFADTADFTPGGTFSAIADQGAINIAEGSAINLNSGGGTSASGQFELKAPAQSVELLGDIYASGGSTNLEVGRFSPSFGFDALMSKVAVAGINNVINFRAVNADINQHADQVIHAKTLSLTADNGSITVAGKLNVNSTMQAGKIALNAGDTIQLEAGSQVTATGDQGGSIILSAVDNDNDGKGKIIINEAALIDVSGSDASKGGAVNLRALINAEGIAIDPIKGKITGTGVQQAVVSETGLVIDQGNNKFTIEGVTQYSNADLSIANQLNNTDYQHFAEALAVQFTSEKSALINQTLGTDAVIKPGIEINYEGDLTLANKWDLSQWRYPSGGTLVTPGNLTIKTSGNFNVNASLSDGFKDGALMGVNIKDLMQTDRSWSYQLTAGADLASANSTTTATAKNIIIGENTAIRTGTGDINLTAGNDVVFTNQTATLYSAGRAETSNRYGTLNDTIVAFLLYGEYPVEGGNLTVNAGNAIQGAVTNQFIDNWLLRIGDWSANANHEGELPTVWTVALGYTSDGYGNAADGQASLFQENIGSFGGGAVSLSAQGNINDLSVMMPTTGKQIGEPNTATFSDFLNNQVLIQGGGSMTVSAGGDIAGGAYYLAKGNAEITAGGAIKGSDKQFVHGPQLVSGDTTFSLNAKNGIKISAVSDGMMLHSGNNYAPNGTEFFSYSDISKVAVKSLSGDVHFGSDTSVIGDEKMLSMGGSQSSLAKIYPASLAATAFGGSVALDSQVTLFPAPNATLQILAKDNISSNVDSLRLSMSDADKNLLPNVLYPLAKNQLNDAEAILNPYGINMLVHAGVPVHSQDKEPIRVVTNEGDIRSIQINAPKKAIIQSGNDISNVLINLQHITAADATVISAARDILFTSERSQDGLLVDNFNEIKVAGPGNVLVTSGRNIDFGASGGLSTIGNLANTNLSSDVGANIAVIAGMGSRSTPNYLGIFDLDPDVLKYAANHTKFLQVITGFMREKTNNTALTEKPALEQFKALTPAEYASIQPQLDALVSNQYTNLTQEMTQLITEYLRYGDNFSQYNQLVTNFMRDKLADPFLSEQSAIEGFRKLSPEMFASIQTDINALVSTQYLDKSVVEPAQILATFEQLPADQYLPIQSQLNTILNRVLFDELKYTGAASAISSDIGNERGFTAITNLFPGTEWKGNLSLFFSKLQTLQGGNIDLVVPGGEINAGLAVSFTGAKAASELGIVAQREGNINAFVNNDFIVNQSRVFALSSGDILIWSSEGDIDAGRGAKSAIAAPPPQYSFDDNGNLVVTFPPIVSGSGIRTAATADKIPGDVFLFAPKGIVNAGEAGIGGTNVTISATAVLGANNIQVGGVSSGVPAASSGSLAAGLTGVSNLTANVSQVAQSSTDMNKDSKDADAKSMKMGVISVDLIGYGEGESDDSKKNKAKN